jgi:hypothetical protein
MLVWNFGDIASDGLKQVAEWGAIGTMQKEIKNHVLSTCEQLLLCRIHDVDYFVLFDV